VPLVDLTMVEQRYDAVKEVLDGATETEGKPHLQWSKSLWTRASRLRQSL
jgi:hypothetical protein